MSHKGRKRSKGTKKKQGRGPMKAGFQLVAHPFSQVDPEALRAAFIEKAESSAENLPIHIHRLEEILREHDPILVLATIAHYGSLQGVGPNGPDGKTMLSGVDQHHIELLQAIVLTIPPGQWGSLLYVAPAIDEVIRLTGEIAEEFATARMVNMRIDLDAEKKVQRSLQERLRLHTQVVRNWGYAHQVITISTELYRTVDKELEAALGFSCTDLIMCMKAIVSLYERRGSERFVRLRRVVRTKTKKGLVHAYYREFTELEGTPEAFLKGTKNISFNDIKYMMLSHADLRLPDESSCSARDLAEETGLEEVRLQAVLAKLSREPGELFGKDPMHFFMDNPVWSKPGIKVGESFMFPIAQVGLSHIHRILRPLIEEAGAKKIYESRRAIYLERKAGEILRRAFPSADLIPSAKWTIGKDTYETDWLVVLDRTVLIVEAKSAALTSEALRGAPDRVKKHIGDLVVAPALQSARLQDVINKAGHGDHGSTELLKEIGINVSKVDTVIRLSVTLDDFSMVTAAEGDLKEAGWVPKELDLPATMNVADFESVVDILERDALILHYLEVRPRLQQSAHLLADELDLLGIYLETLFHIPEVASEELSLVATGQSKSIDDYYGKLEAEVPAEKPKAAILPELQRILDMLAERKPPGWTTMSIDLLQIGSLDGQKEVWDAVEKLRRDVPMDFKDPNHKCAITILPAGLEVAIAIYVYPDAVADRRKEVMAQLADELLASSGRKRITIIGKKIEFWDLPYTLAAIGYQSDRTD